VWSGHDSRTGELVVSSPTSIMSLNSTVYSKHSLATMLILDYRGTSFLIKTTLTALHRQEQHGRRLESDTTFMVYRFWCCMCGVTLQITLCIGGRQPLSLTHATLYSSNFYEVNLISSSSRAPRTADRHTYGTPFRWPFRWPSHVFVLASPRG
jgi:hypothetical protein